MNELTKRLLRAHADGLELILDSNCLGSIETDKANYDLGYINAMLLYNVETTQEDLESLFEAINAYKESLC